MTYFDYIRAPFTVHAKVPFSRVVEEAMKRHKAMRRFHVHHEDWSIACDCIDTILGLYDINGERIKGDKCQHNIQFNQKGTQNA